MFPKSLKWRLQIWHGGILLIVLAGFGFTAHRLQHATEMRRVDEELIQRVNLLTRNLDRPFPQGRRSRPGRPDPEDGSAGTQDFPPPPASFRLRPDVEQLFASDDANAGYYVIWRRDGVELGRSTNAPSATQPQKPTDSPAARPQLRTVGTLREAYRFTPPGECLLTGRSIQPELQQLKDFALWLAALGTGVLALGLGGGWWMASRAIRPINDISAAAEKIAGGSLSHRVRPADPHSELGRLTTVLNSTFARLEAAFRRQEQFTADASHELRTPISVILNQTQSTLARERPAAEYREALEACQRAATRMSRLTESLLALARLDAGQDEMKRAPIDLAHIANDCLGQLRPLAAAQHITIHADLAPCLITGDTEHLTRVLTNLLSNAIQYNHHPGEVRLTTGTENDKAIVTISNTGPGIDVEHLPHVFERFYRADQARTAARGNAGLGLAISQAIVAAHGGTIEATSPEKNHTQFTVRLPCRAAELKR